MAVPRNTLTRSELPAKRAYRFGLASVTETTSAANGHWMFGADWLESCGTNVLVAPNNCDPLLDPEDRVKTSFALAAGAGTLDFTLYGFHRCSIIGDPVEERRLYALDELDLGQWAQVERQLLKHVAYEVFSTYPTGISGPLNALTALLAGWDKPVEPIVHMTRNVAMVLSDYLIRVDDHLELKTGERVSVGYGDLLVAYEQPADVRTGAIMLTGPVFATIGSDSDIGGETVDRETNTYLALVERPISFGYLCGATWVQVNDVITTTE
jgi:hypothetical protein